MKQRGHAHCLPILLAVSLALASTVVRECGAKLVLEYVFRLVICPDHQLYE